MTRVKGPDCYIHVVMGLNSFVNTTIAEWWRVAYLDGGRWTLEREGFDNVRVKSSPVKFLAN